MANRKKMKILNLLILFLFLVLFTLNISTAQPNPLNSVPGGDLIQKFDIDENTGEPRKITEIKDKIDEFRDQDDDYLAEQWKKMLLKNRFVSSADEFFNEWSIISKILFGVPYTFSLKMFFIVVLWLSIFLGLPKIISYIEIFDNISSWLISLLIVTILAQFQFFRVIIEFLDKLLISPENQWVRLILGIVIFFIMVLIYYLESACGKYLEQIKEERKKDEAEQAREEMISMNKGMRKDLGR